MYYLMNKYPAMLHEEKLWNRMCSASLFPGFQPLSSFYSNTGTSTVFLWYVKVCPLSCTNLSLKCSHACIHTSRSITHKHTAVLQDVCVCGSNCLKTILSFSAEKELWRMYGQMLQTWLPTSLGFPSMCSSFDWAKRHHRSSTISN